MATSTTSHPRLGIYQVTAAARAIAPHIRHALTGVLTAARINILHVGIHRVGPYTSLGRVGLDVIVDTRDRDHAQSVLALVRDAGFPAEELADTRPGSS